MRINKYLSDAGYSSRRKADELVKSGQVFINGKKAVPLSLVNENDQVKVFGKLVQKESKKLYLAYHKPVGVICTTDQSKPNNIIERIGLKERIYPVGRLDVESSGLILLTNDGDFANKLMHPRYGHEKEYLVETGQAVTGEIVSRLTKGVRLEEGLAKADRASRLSATGIKIVLHQGWNRQIRRMLEKIGCRVKSLKRVRMGEIELGPLKPDEWRFLTAREVKESSL